MLSIPYLRLWGKKDCSIMAVNVLGSEGGWTIDGVYVLSQILAAIGISALALSYVCREKKAVTICCAVYSLFYAGQYLLLGGATGVAISLVGALRSLWFYYCTCRGKKSSLCSLLTIFGMYALGAVFTIDNWIGVFMLAGALVVTYALWQDNVQVYGFASIPVSLLWIVYNIRVRSIVGVLAEIIVLGFVIAGILKRHRQSAGKSQRALDERKENTYNEQKL